MQPYKILLAVQLLLTVVHANHQIYPGTSTRPILSDTEAAEYTKEKYLQGWVPERINVYKKYDYVVGHGGFKTIQEAVNAAIRDGGTTRKYIKIRPGTYTDIVLIPKTNVSITLYGTPGNPEDVHIIRPTNSTITGADYANKVNPNGTIYKKGDPAYLMYSKCAARPIIGTTCSSAFRADNDNLEVAYVTIENPSSYMQSVAVAALGDKQVYKSVNFYGFQDTLFVKYGRLYFVNSTILGDVDFIFGQASAVFESTNIIARGDRRDKAIVFAPNTPRNQTYGFLVTNCKISADSNIKVKKGCMLARDWLARVGDNGQLVIRETEIDDVLNVTVPYGASTSNQTYIGDIHSGRNLNNPRYSRFWEYKNYGPGS